MPESFADATDPAAAAIAAEAEQAEKEGRKPRVVVTKDDPDVAGVITIGAATDEFAAIDEADAMAKLQAATGISDAGALQAIIEAATKNLTASHKAEMTALRKDLESVRQEGREGNVTDLNESAGGYPWMYYKIPQTFPDEQRRGWVTMGPGGASPRTGHRDTGSFAAYLKKGFIPITKYGLCPVPVDPRVAKNYEAFVKHGGAVEFPGSQIVAYQWHKNNPFVGLGVRWTQLDSIIDKLITWQCEYCGFEMDFMPGDRTAGTAYRVHLVNTDKVPFKEAIEAVKAAGLTTTPFKSRTIEEISQMASPLG